jgi:hypothetical protein
MKYAAETASGAMIYVRIKYHKRWFGHSEVSEVGKFTDTNSMETA